MKKCFKYLSKKLLIATFIASTSMLAHDQTAREVQLRSDEIAEIFQNEKTYVFMGDEASTLLATIKDIVTLADSDDAAPHLRALIEHADNGYKTAPKEMVLEVLEHEAPALLEKHHAKITDDAQLETIIENLNKAWEIIDAEREQTNTITRRINPLKIFGNIKVLRAAEIGTLYVDRDETIAGNLNIFGNLDVHGVTNLADVAIHGAVDINSGVLALRELKLLENPTHGTDSITLQAPDMLTNSYALTLPPDDGTAGQLLTTDGNGTLFWTNGGSGSGIINLIADDVGVATGANVTIAGGSNINTSASGSTLTINLDNSISVPGSIDTGTTLTAGTGLTVTSGGITSTGTTTLHSLGLGIVQASSTGSLSSSDGADGQILIGSSALDVAPLWAHITPGAGIDVTNGPGSITLALSGIGGPYVLKTGDTMTGPLQLPAGTAVAPSLTFTDSTATGLSAPTNNTLVAITGGVTRMTIDSTGNVTVPGTILADGGIDVTEGGASDTLNIGTTNADTINLGTATTIQVINIGTGPGETTINIGSSLDTINIAGTLVTVNTTNLDVTNKLITLNDGGPSGSGFNSGIVIEEAGSTKNPGAGYCMTSTDRASWVMSAPTSTGEVTLTAGANGFTLDRGSIIIGSPANGLSLTTGASPKFYSELSLASATTTQAGAVILATNAETIAGTNTTKAVTPDDLTAKLGVQTAHGVLIGEGTSSAISATSAGTSGQLLQSKGASTDPEWTTSTYPSTNSQGDLIYGSAINTLSTLAKNTSATRYLANTGINNNPNWDVVNVANGVTGTLPIANGGTGATSFTTNGVLYRSGLSILSTAQGATNTVLLGNGGVPSFGAVPNGALANSTITLNNGSNISITGSPVALGGIATINLVDSPSVTGSITAGTEITASSGNITTNAGNVVIQEGNLDLSPNPSTERAGNIMKRDVSFLHNANSIDNTFLGISAGNFRVKGTLNTGLGYESLFNVIEGGSNTAIGAFSLTSNITGNNNAAVGENSMGKSNEASQNVALGYFSLFQTNSNDNIGIGFQAGASLTKGQHNIFIGSGTDVTPGGESRQDTIAIGYGTQSDADNQIRIGFGLARYNNTFIDGIRDTTTTLGDAIPVLIDSAGQLGTVSSSRRYKENIKTMGDISNNFMQLNPVEFTYKSDGSHTAQYGLIAEEVEPVFPELVVYNKEGGVETVKYHLLDALYIKMIQDLQRRIEALEQAQRV